MKPPASRKLTLLSLLWGLSGIWAQTRVTSLSANEGQRVVLKALYKPDSVVDLSTKTVVWNYKANNNNNTQLIISYTQGKIDLGSSQFVGRAGFVASMPSQDVSLYINNTQDSDSGHYMCQIIPLFLEEFDLDVKVPPSVPECSVSEKPVLKGNVTLTCLSKSGKPAPLYKWKRTSPTSEVFFSPMLNEKTGTLKLTNLSLNLSGKYVCNASNAAGSESCFINLEIVGSNKVGMIVGATVGSVLGFILLLFICVVFLFFFKRRRENEDDMANEIKEDAQAPKRVSWAKSGMGSDVISKNGTLSSVGSSPHHRESSHHHNNHHLQQYPQHPASDSASIITATGSTAGYRPPRHHGASTPTHYNYNNSSTLPHGPPESSEPGTRGGPPSVQERYRPPESLEPGTRGGPPSVQERYSQLPQVLAAPQSYGLSPPPAPTFTASNISRMGGVPIMVPAQNQAGSLV
ncbi:endothelial cell-selective adhesion molecule [Austrofundulus limnaeus]|uniref:Endothelial cell-selective adhesion molecule n=1 Tax=Austrofundulus limnaeus TaxID=52670 RepID=A0A2I4CTY2_AUSLI|nr:PREDICTED: endothelial cell-selective adhesion molecule-like [Austrofundulus limnaeus]